MSTGSGSKARRKRKSPANEALARGLRFERERVVIELLDDREISVPLSRFPTLQRAKASERKTYHRLNGGAAFHWPALDLDLSTAGLITGSPEHLPAPPKSQRPGIASARGAA